MDDSEWVISKKDIFADFIRNFVEFRSNRDNESSVDN